MTSLHDVRKLASLDDWQLENSDQDLRGKTPYDVQGHDIGRVDDMLADLAEKRIIALRLHDDRVVPIANVDLRNGHPVLTVEASRLPQPASGFDRNAVTSEHVPIIEETLDVGKRQVDLGTVRVHSRVVSQKVGADVTLHDEQVNVERKAMNEPISSADADALLQDSTVEMSETAERIVTDKRAAVTGEVVVDKDVGARTERVEGVVRHTEVDVDRDAERR